MKIYKRLTVAILSLPLIMGTMPAFAEGKNQNRCIGKVKPKHLLRNIELTNAQEEQLKALNKKNREEFMANQKNKADKTKENLNLHNQMQDYLLTDTFDEKKVRELAEKMAEDHVNRRLNRIQKQHAILKILTPEQKKQVKINMEKMAENCMHSGKQEHKNLHPTK